MNLFNSLVKYSFKKDTGFVNLTAGFFLLLVRKMFLEGKRSILIVTSNGFEARKLYNSYSCFENSFLFENDDIYGDETVVSPELLVDRINILNDLSSGDNAVVFTDVSGYLKILPAKSEFKDKNFDITVDMEIPYEDIVSKFSDMGYVRESFVSKTGEFALRGYVLDIFPINSENPLRIEFFGDSVSSIRYFDVDSQRSLSNILEFSIFPFNEAFKIKSNLYEYLDNPIVIFKDYEQVKFCYENMVSDASLFSYDFSSYFYNFDDICLNDVLYYFDLDNKVSFQLDDIVDFSVKAVPNFYENFDEINTFVNKCISNFKTVVIFVDIPNFGGVLNKFDFDYVLTNFSDIYDGKVNIIKGPFCGGFESSKYVVLTSSELFNRKSVALKKVRFKDTSRIKDLMSLEIGDYVVHYSHGIGIYNGIRSLSKNGFTSDYLEILYDKGDKLYVPVAKLDIISKYNGKDGYAPKINSLNSTVWEKTKRRIREKIKYESERIIRVQAERSLKKGFAFSKDMPLQVMFENEFIYDETPDQLKAINDIKTDMESVIPMDRILCGDVGYGKTEVAFRAMFKAVMDNKQVLYLCPTTLLSKQQYEVALERFKNFPVNIGILNRFVSQKDVVDTLNKLKNGQLDILFGTHRILSDDVICHDLGLLVIDEEQRFGVAHKEKIKEMKSNVDVLTLTATPIPRTLQLAILGIRSLSVIETPPLNRKPAVTYVTGYDEKLIRDVIFKEVSRGGQVFILYNRVSDIEVKLNHFRSLTPGVTFTCAHGRMDKNIFEDVINDFVDGKFDVLLCTTIIETGIDIPNANSLIVLDADRFGLSQLYQIRGRVGRSDRLAYAYFMYDKGRILTETAVKRLNVIKEYTKLGSGFAIATRDLSIRGAGDILGSEQAGFIDAVGIDLYLNMLNEEIAKLKGEEVVSVSDDAPLINISSHVKDSYVEDEDVKILIHRLINSISDAGDYEKVKAEIEDRFGKVDEDLLVYMNEQLFEFFVKKLGIIKVFDNNKYREVIFNKDFLNKLSFDDVFMKSLEINKKFNFSYKNNMLSVSLMYNNSRRHIGFDFNDFFRELL